MKTAPRGAGATVGRALRPGLVAALSLVSAAVGGAVVLLLAAATGRVAGEPTRTVVVPAPVRGTDVPASAEPGRRDLPGTEAAGKPLPGNAFQPTRIYAARAAGVVTVYSLFGDHARAGRGAQGSGFVISRDGLVLTSAHVITTAGDDGDDVGEVEGATQAYVEFRDGERVPARVVGWDLFNDVGLLRVDPRRHRLVPLPLGDSSRVVVGEPVAAIGSPFGEESSLAVGVVSATERSIPALTSEYHIVDAIQVDAPINRGNSGGPLFDARGRVIGINAQIRSSSGTAEGVGFAVPINVARRAVRQLLANGRVSYAYIGIQTSDLTPSVARRIGYPARRGALIVDVSGGPGREAGLRGAERTVEVDGREVQAGGDLVVAIDGRAVRSGDDLVRIISQELRPGEVTRLRVLRDRRPVEVVVRLAERPLEPASG